MHGEFLAFTECINETHSAFGEMDFIRPLIIGLVFAPTGEVSQAMLAWDTYECSADVLDCAKGTAAGTVVDERELPELDFPNESELAAEIGSSSILIGDLGNTWDQKIPANSGNDKAGG